MPKKKNPNAYPLGEKIGDIAKWTWEGMTNDIKRAIKNAKSASKESPKGYRDPDSVYVPKQEPVTPGDQAILDDAFWGVPKSRPKKKK